MGKKRGGVAGCRFKVTGLGENWVWLEFMGISNVVVFSPSELSEKKITQIYLDLVRFTQTQETEKTEAAGRGATAVSMRRGSRCSDIFCHETSLQHCRAEVLLAGSTFY